MNRRYERERIIPWMVLAIATAWVAMTAGVPVSAQDGGVPPLPMLFEGAVFLNGEPVAEGDLTVRIGDWESDPVPVVNGAFRCATPCLIAGPPDFTYVGKLVRFHLDSGEPASLSFVFPNATSPSRTKVELMFERESSMAVSGVAIGGAALAMVAAAVYVVRRRVRR